ncbi:hypothetical protein KIH23_12780 [Flavobacterium sp. CYK-55]|uniref:HEAT repeat domain-containing protein n=1 Tax=Flavobacterium sp. CYK-55 TaxID=2835529 RepID=UPI001BD06FA3|nr:HEAT repeat domain-containing protein [Flavobacterium sp. CYK-55]MBS7788174.1 hypothetical protein [Flavobacterium sp. CYK-55]
MTLTELFEDKTLNAKGKTEKLSALLLDETISTQAVIAFAQNTKDADRGTCMEAFEYATRLNSSLATRACLDFATEHLGHKAPRVQWESAKVIGNIAPYFQDDLEPAISGLLINTEHSGTVVRWAAAFALGEIVKLKLPINKDLVPTLENIIEREEKNSIKKIYQAALKKIK